MQTAEELVYSIIYQRETVPIPFSESNSVRSGLATPDNLGERRATTQYLKTKNGIIASQKDFERLCTDLAQEQSIALDTEFVRRDTYYPKLSLIQVATKTYTAIIDTVNLDLEPLKAILLNDKLLKIFHAPKQDFEIFYHLFQITPLYIFDTQLAATCSGLRSAISYADLCSLLCYVDIDKTHQAANWLARPLTDEMLAYAAKDVEYLHDIYEYLHPLITDMEKYQRRLAAELVDPKLYHLSPQNAWKKIKVGTRSEVFIENIKILAAFREETASSLDVPRGHFIPDQALIQICSSLPKNDRSWRAIKWKTKWMKDEKYKGKILDLCASLV